MNTRTMNMKDLMGNYARERRELPVSELTFNLPALSADEKPAVRMVRDLERLLTSDGDGSPLTWTGSKTDLFTLIHLAYTTELITTTDDSLPVQFLSLAHMVCGRLNVRVPRNPSSYVVRNMARKGRFMRPLEERYRGLERFIGG